MKVILANNKLQITFPYNPEIIAKVKTLHSRLYIGGSKWEAPLILENVENLLDWGFTLSPELISWLQKLSADDMPDIAIPGLKRPLIPFQHDGVRWMEAARGRTIIGDQQGLGKTAELLAWLQFHPEARPAVVVCPGNAKYTFQSEAAIMMTKKCTTFVVSGEFKGRENVKKLPEADIFIINYEILYYTTECPFCTGKGWKDMGPKKTKCRACHGNGKTAHVRPDLLMATKGKHKVVILDECQYLQEPYTYRTQSVQALCKGVPFIFPSSGTPIKHRPKNFFVALNLTRPDLFPSYFSYAHSYCGAVKGKWGWNFEGSSNMQKLHDFLYKHKVLLRRTKKEVLPQLPKIRRATVMLDLNPEQWKAYNAAANDFLVWLAKYDTMRLCKAEKAKALTKINYLKQMAARFKINQTIKWIEDFLETGRHLIVFAHHKSVVDRIYSHFKNIALRVDSSATAEQKRDYETAFQACGTCGQKKDKHDNNICTEYTPGQKRLFIGTLAAKESLTLTAAEDVTFVEFWDSPKDHEQAEERCYGRVSDPHGTTAWYLVCNGTIEEDLLCNQEKKREIIDAIIDGKEVEENSLVDLLNAIKKRGRTENVGI